MKKNYTIQEKEAAKIYIKSRSNIVIGGIMTVAGLCAESDAFTAIAMCGGVIIGGYGIYKYDQARNWATDTGKKNIFNDKFLMECARNEIYEETKNFLSFKKRKKSR